MYFLSFDISTEHLYIKYIAMFGAEHMVNNVWKKMEDNLPCDILTCEF